jgi:hypothetical protein
MHGRAALPAVHGMGAFEPAHGPIPAIVVLFLFASRSSFR